MDGQCDGIGDYSRCSECIYLMEETIPHRGIVYVCRGKFPHYIQPDDIEDESCCPDFKAGGRVE